MFVITPELCIEKTVDFDADGTYTDAETYYAGEVAHWRINVSNCGAYPVSDIYVTDDNGESYGPFSLLPGESDVYDYDTYPTADVNNTACATGVDEIGGTVGPVCDPAEVFVIIEGGCTYTPGYWMTHSAYGPAGPTDPTWMELPDMDGDGVVEGPDELFYGNNYGLTWLSVMSFSAQEAKLLGLRWVQVQVYQHMAFHYVAAVLNGIMNGEFPSGIDDDLNDAEAIFVTYHNMKIPLLSYDALLARLITRHLADFNEGYLPGWPHCDD